MTKSTVRILVLIKGLGIGGVENASDQPWYVVDKDLSNNRLVVAQGEHHERLYYSACRIQDLHWISQNRVESFDCSAKIRYRQQDNACRIGNIENGNAVVEFMQPQRAITPGQALVLYDGEQCLGGGTIESAFNPD